MILNEIVSLEQTLAPKRSVQTENLENVFESTKVFPRKQKSRLERLIEQENESLEELIRKTQLSDTQISVQENLFVNFPTTEQITDEQICQNILKQLEGVTEITSVPQPQQTEKIGGLEVGIGPKLHKHFLKVQHSEYWVKFSLSETGDGRYAYKLLEYSKNFVLRQFFTNEFLVKESEM